MPMIKVEMFAGRTDDQKRKVVEELTAGFVRATGAPPEAVDVILVEVEKSDWARGGVLFSDRG